MSGEAFRVIGVRKRYGATVALDGVDLAVASGSIHAVLGENGAGKSSLMRILAGAVRPDAGSMSLFGSVYAPRSPLAARERGVAMIHQELALAPHLTAVANVRLGRERVVDPAAARAALASLGLAAAADRPVAELAPGERQSVEIARALADQARVLILDEPTSSLGREEIARVFAILRRLRAEGRAILFISHHLDEVRAIADRCTILRDGRTVATAGLDELDDDAIIERMTGRTAGQLFPLRSPRFGEVVLEVRGLSGARLPNSASLELRRGEILGIAGLVGAGRTELLRGVMGLDPIRSGTVLVHGARVAPRPDRLLARGVGLLSEDRKHEGLALGMSVAENVTLSSLDREVRASLTRRAGWVRRSTLRRRAEHWIARLAIKARDADGRAAELSGGNQQKVALARLLERDVDVLILDEPTRGVDVASRAEIYRTLAELAGAGKGILVVSSVNQELLGICDRIAVMCRGRLGPARPVADWNEESIVRAAAAASPEGEAA
jgi:ribose transport system ATP-binding protein